MNANVVLSWQDHNRRHHLTRCSELILLSRILSVGDQRNRRTFGLLAILLRRRSVLRTVATASLSVGQRAKVCQTIRLVGSYLHIHLHIYVLKPSSCRVLQLSLSHKSWRFTKVARSSLLVIYVEHSTRPHKERLTHWHTAESFIYL